MSEETNDPTSAQKSGGKREDEEVIPLMTSSSKAPVADEQPTVESEPEPVTEPEPAPVPRVPTVAQKAALSEPAGPDNSRVIEIPNKWGDRGVQKKFLESLNEGASQIWGSRVLVLLVIIVVSCIYLGTDLVAFFSNNEVMVSVDREKVKVSLQEKATTGGEAKEQEQGPVQIPIRTGSGWASIIGHLILVILSIRCLMLMFRKERNSLDYSLTQF